MVIKLGQLIKSQNVISPLKWQRFMKLRVYRKKRDVFTKSKDTSLTGLLELSVINLFFVFSRIKLLQNRSDFRLKALADAWPRF